MLADEIDIRFENFTSQISGNYDISAVFRQLSTETFGININDYLHSCWKIRDAMPQAISIDNFIDARDDDPRIEVCGKLGITATILKAESKSKLAVNPLAGEDRPNFKALADTWHNSFFQLLTENCKKADLPERLKKVALIIFNYDRCVEMFLLHALKNYYTIETSEALSLLQHVEIYHPYGVVGALQGVGEGVSVSFGATPHSTQLLAISKQIKTFTEGTDESASHIIRIRELMAKSHRLIFLGFAYHKLNMQLLFKKPSGLMPLETRKIYGTALSISDSDVDIITKELAQYTETDSVNVELRNELTCAGLFKGYWRSMSLN